MQSDILSYFPQARRRKTNKWMVNCPCHEDKNASLEIEIKEDRILIHCFAGCHWEQIIKALGLTKRDLFMNEFKRTSNQPERRHEYRDLDGKLLYENLIFRKPDGSKYANVRRPDGQGKWVWNLDGIERVLYRLADLRYLLSKNQNRIVAFVEGEKCVDDLLEHRIAATTIFGGADAKWCDSYTQAIHDLSITHLALLPDNDPPGLRLMERVAGTMLVQGDRLRSLRIVNLDVPAKGDVSDWLKANNQDSGTLLDIILKSEPCWEKKR